MQAIEAALTPARQPDAILRPLQETSRFLGAASRKRSRTYRKLVGTSFDSSDAPNIHRFLVARNSHRLRAPNPTCVGVHDRSRKQQAAKCIGWRTPPQVARKANYGCRPSSAWSCSSNTQFCDVTTARHRCQPAAHEGNFPSSIAEPIAADRRASNKSHPVPTIGFNRFNRQGTVVTIVNGFRPEKSPLRCWLVRTGDGVRGHGKADPRRLCVQSRAQQPLCNFATRR